MWEVDMNSAKQLVFTFSSYFKPISCANTCYLCCFHLETFLACSLQYLMKRKFLMMKMSTLGRILMLLSRMFNILRENNPELAGDRRRTVIRPPQVLREGTKKTVFVNFMDLCKTMHRQPEHVMTFLLAEMGTSGSLDGKQRLVVKGIFAPKNFEGILRRYINEYVMCNCCKSPDTILTKENRLFFLRCEQCGSSRSVALIKAGFIARVEHRKAGT
ncbi:eukaryotic translation initiation factor 2 subunit beta-like isoform X4 [Quercus robur]|uniref:eukaryotic translation initiation factor 2 subunit beta-like isoform X4 n=1 Tax=Quercus robur TaxID=38942 RepID=UPI002162DA2D|nr:eukaryotic translation initiation factor 2 subunit beta-like isoform X4 [Quercus robur]